MDRSFPPPSIVVGIDGSKAAVRAALWAVDEAVHRDIPLRLVHVIDADPTSNPKHRHLRRAYAAAYQVAHEAWCVVESTGEPVKIEMEILRGDPVAELVQASRHAALICLGSRRHHRHPGRRSGTTAAMVAESAMCSAVVIRRRSAPRTPPEDGRIVAVLDESPASHAVLQTAIDQARLRDVPVLALTPWPVGTQNSWATQDEDDLRTTLDRHLDASKRGEADVEVCMQPMPGKLCKMLARSADIEQLVVVGRSEADITTQLIGPKGRSTLRKTSCSVLVVR